MRTPDRSRAFSRGLPARRACRVLVFVAAGIILVLSLLPGLPAAPGGVQHTDKIGHFLAYFGLGFLVTRSGWTAGTRRDVLLALAVALVFGGAVEWLQRLTGRHPEFLDLLADGLGAAAGGTAAALAHRRQPPGRALPGSTSPPGESPP